MSRLRNWFTESYPDGTMTVYGEDEETGELRYLDRVKEIRYENSVWTAYHKDGRTQELAPMEKSK